VLRLRERVSGLRMSDDLSPGARHPDGLRVFVRTLGCKVNQAESEQIAVGLVGAGARIVAEDVADVVVVNTCTVTGEADTKTRKAVRQALRRSSEALVVVTGCLATLDPEGLAALGTRVIVEPRKEEVAARIIRMASPGTPHESVRTGGPARTGERFHSRVMVKIEDGCDAFCSYCIVPYARGGPRAVPLGAIVDEVSRLVESGAAEVVLTGINLGRYADGDAGLAQVVEAVSRTGVARIRISSIEPVDLSDELLGILASAPNVAPHLHVPLQAGDDAVLKAMGRRYTTAEYADRMSAARNALGPIAVTTDVIAGFPGESPEQAERTVAFCESMGFARLHVFRFSARAGTPAATMAGQVEPKERSRRAERLRSLDRTLRERYTATRLGHTAEVLVERVAPTFSVDGASTQIAEGTSEDYLRVSFPALGVKPGQLVTVGLVSDAGATVSAER
jgi:threonylcarbamoyladenosine tRNA methylthiotransferase MtaB